MKRIAFYVEGVTEQFFINKLLIELAGKNNIEIQLEQFIGADKGHKTEIHPKTSAQPVNPTHHALILDCAGDSSVKSRILDDYQKLFSKGYGKVIGLLDLYPLKDLSKFQNELNNGRTLNGRQLTAALPENTAIIIAVQEIEAWFLAEHSHFLRIDSGLTNELINEKLNFNPADEDMTLREQPAQDLHNAYQLVGKFYMGSNGRKRKNKIEATVESLDYDLLSSDLAQSISPLSELITVINDFLTTDKNGANVKPLNAPPF